MIKQIHCSNDNSSNHYDRLLDRIDKEIITTELLSLQIKNLFFSSLIIIICICVIKNIYQNKYLNIISLILLLLVIISNIYLFIYLFNPKKYKLF